MESIIFERTVSLDGAGKPELLQGTLYAAENQAHTFRITAVKAGEKVVLAGTVSASFIRPNQETVVMTGSIDDGCAVVTLPQSCYTESGRFTLTIFATEDGVKVALFCLMGNVKQTTTDTIVDPGEVMPAYEDLIEEMEEVRDSIPADYTELSEDVADLKSAFGDIADLPIQTILEEKEENFVGPGNKRIEVTDLSAGDIIKVDVTVTEAAGASWEILTSTTPIGSTIRQISGEALSDNTVSTKTITLQGEETSVVVRILINQSTGNRKYWNVTVSEISQMQTTVKMSAIPADFGSIIDDSKKIVWFGTSIPEGNLGTLSYPLVLGNKLGVTVYNEAVGSSRARASWIEFVSESNPLGAGSGYNSMIKAMGYTLAEKQDFIDNYDELKSGFTDTHPESLDAATQLAIKNYSFERKLYRYLTAKQTVYNTVNTTGFVGDVDIYVLDHGFNDIPNNPYASDTTIPELGDTHEMYYFAGALNRYIMEIMQANIHARIVMISHYANDGGEKPSAVCEMQEKVAKYWNIPIVKVYETIGWTSNEITIDGNTTTVKNAWLPDGTHPASDTSGKAVERYVNTIYPMFRDLLQKY